MLNKTKPYCLSPASGECSTTLQYPEDLEASTPELGGPTVLNGPPSDFYFFPKLMENLRGMRFDSDDEVKKAVANYFRKTDQDFFSTYFKKWVQSLQKCIDVGGDYVKK